MHVDPRAEWKQIFDEAWRINRDVYAPTMHGINWARQHEKYAAFLPHVATPPISIACCIAWTSELAVRHHNVGCGDTLTELKTVPGGLVGANYEIANGRQMIRPAPSSPATCSATRLVSSGSN